MSESKHTAGPWYADPADDGLILAEGGPCIGRVYNSDDFPCLDLTEAEEEQFDSEVAGNARLIAAAPTMYEALKGLIEDYQRLIGDGVTEATEPAVLTAARAAIRAATGGENG